MQPKELTPTQIGALGEMAVASQLILTSGGRLSPFSAMADDDGIDLLVLDKRTRSAIPLQVKTRTSSSAEPPATFQFDIRLNTFTKRGDALLLSVVLERETLTVKRAWLIPMSDLQDLSRRNRTKLSITPSAKLSSRDRFTPYRCTDMVEVTERLLGHFDASSTIVSRSDNLR